jgi:flagellar basal body-associated protein FliL
MQPKKKSNLMIYIVIGVVLALLAGGLLMALTTSKDVDEATRRMNASQEEFLKNAEGMRRGLHGR